MWIYVHTKVIHSEKKETNIRGNGLGPSKMSKQNQCQPVNKLWSFLCSHQFVIKSVSSKLEHLEQHNKRFKNMYVHFLSGLFSNYVTLYLHTNSLYQSKILSKISGQYQIKHE